MKNRGGYSDEISEKRYESYTEISILLGSSSVI